MIMKASDTASRSRIDRELERERQERHRNDEARTGELPDDDLRVKDARESNSSGQLHRNGGR
jgi:hypothetical protein